MKDSRSQHDFFDWLLICAGLFWLPMWMIAILKQKVLEVSYLDDYKGIKIYDATIHRDKFHSVVTAALHLVEGTDPRRFHRIQRNCRKILHAVSPYFMASYSWGDHLCFVDLRYFMDRDDDDAVFSLAATLVHEATHGEIEAWGIRSNKKNRLRIERLCHVEEARFTRRVVPDYQWQDFDETPYQDYFAMKMGERIKMIVSTIITARNVNRTARLEKDNQ